MKPERLESLIAHWLARCGPLPPEALRRYAVPGRVNLLGEHLDYNGGWVFPCGISRGLWAVATPRTDDQIRVHSLQFSEVAVFSLAQTPERNQLPTWATYVAGVIHELKAVAGTDGNPAEQCCGFELLLDSDLPIGSGLSSSAAIEALTAIVATDLWGWALHHQPLGLTQLCRRAEQVYVGVSCGIMDQYAVLHARAGEALLLKCREEVHVPIPLPVDSGVCLAVLDTRKPRALVESKYNERFAECQEALALLRARGHELTDLADATLGQIDRILDPVLRIRMRHVVTEQARMRQLRDAARPLDWHLLGTLMDASHASLKEDYAVTGVELDTIVELAQQHKACLGARMTGAGFGGCAIALVETAAWSSFADDVTQGYAQRMGTEPEVFPVETSDGARRLPDTP
jgi:galactokinase